MINQFQMTDFQVAIGSNMIFFYPTRAYSSTRFENIPHFKRVTRNFSGQGRFLKVREVR